MTDAQMLAGIVPVRSGGTGVSGWGGARNGQPALLGGADGPIKFGAPVPDIRTAQTGNITVVMDGSTDWLLFSSLAGDVTATLPTFPAGSQLWVTRDASAHALSLKSPTSGATIATLPTTKQNFVLLVTVDGLDWLVKAIGTQ